MTSKNHLPPGTQVTWTSQANGTEKTKTGTVIAYCPAWEHPLLAMNRRLLPTERADGLAPSPNNRYIVSVPRGGKSSLADIYTPRANLVEPASNNT